MKKIIIAVEHDENHEQKIRALKTNPDAVRAIAALNDELTQTAALLVSEIKSKDFPACPCIVADLLQNFNSGELTSIIKVESFLAAMIARADEDFTMHFRVLTHAISRQAELESDAVLEMSDFRN